MQNKSSHSRIGDSSSRILVLGEVCRDIYIRGSITRKSPENKNTNVLKVHSKDIKDGMALNVFNNLSDIDARVCILTDVKVPKIKKVRVFNGKEQIVRIDFDEYRKDIDEKTLISRIEQMKESISTIIISDYGKGYFSKKFLAYIFSLGIDTFVDPYPTTPLSWYKGCNFIVPNLKEAKVLTGEKTIPKIINVLHQVTGGFPIIKSSEKGMDTYDCHYGVPELVMNPEPTGAGDTVIALLAYFYDLGYSVDECIRAANMAAGFVVQKDGVASPTKKEMKAIFKYIRNGNSRH
jgi:D-beta-D-heptose 7-phosphate kinase / D-beta-D-heptose 1-phosphate adenosyltransferase